MLGLCFGCIFDMTLIASCKFRANLKFNLKRCVSRLLRRLRLVCHCLSHRASASGCPASLPAAAAASARDRALARWPGPPAARGQLASTSKVASESSESLKKCTNRRARCGFLTFSTAFRVMLALTPQLAGGQPPWRPGGDAAAAAPGRGAVCPTTRSQLARGG